MSVLSLINGLKNGIRWNDTPFEQNKLEKENFMDYLHLVMMQEFLMNLKYLQM